MKKKFALISSLALVGVIGVGFAAWQFGSATTANINIGVGIAPANVEGGVIDSIQAPTTLTLDDVDAGFDIVFQAKFTPAEGATMAGHVLSYTVALPAALADYLVITTADLTWVSETNETIHIDWKAKDRGTVENPDVGIANPITYAEYAALKTIVDALGTSKIDIVLSVAKV